MLKNGSQDQGKKTEAARKAYETDSTSASDLCPLHPGLAETDRPNPVLRATRANLDLKAGDLALLVAPKSAKAALTAIRREPSLTANARVQVCRNRTPDPS